ncbi:MAG: hypothetical protein PHC38_01610 [Weeksellaceae bacterium]|nr:hypothetical protein [Weeksellaceae bacterium]
MTPLDLEKIRPLLKTKFQHQLLDACAENLKSDSKLRFSNFAYSIRELSRHFLKSLAPDEEVKNSVWFKNESGEKDVITRGERIKYAIQEGLQDRFLDRECLPLEELNEVKKDVVKAITTLSKFTHINEDTFNLSDEDEKIHVKEIISAFIRFSELISETRDTIIHKLEDLLSEELMEKVMYDVSDDVDILSTHHWVEDVEIYEFHIVKLESEHIYVEANGSIDFLLQYGSDKDVERDIGAQLNTSFPFDAMFKIKLSKNLKNSKPEIENYKVNTDDWYE